MKCNIGRFYLKSERMKLRSFFMSKAELRTIFVPPNDIIHRLATFLSLPHESRFCAVAILFSSQIQLHPLNRLNPYPIHDKKVRAA